MKQTICLLSLIIAAVVGAGQTLQSLDGTTVITSHRPLADAADMLERKFGWVITYEDPIWGYESEVVDLAPRIKPGARRFPAPRQGRIAIGQLLPVAGVRADRDTLISKLLQAQDEAGNPGSFKGISDGGFLHLVPAFVNDAAGKRKAYLPLLDTPVHIPIDEGPPSLAIRGILDQVGRTRGVQIETEMGGLFDQNVFGPVKVRVDASGQPARSLLGRIIKEAIRPMTWHLLCEPSLPDHQGFCVFNLRRVYVNVTDASGETVQRPLP